MKIHAFKVEKSENSSDLVDLLKTIKKQSKLKKRIRLVNKIEVRVESIKKEDGLWFIDLVRFRSDHGPGRVGENAEVQGFDFEDGESFGEETAVLYDPKTNYIIIQYNHSGVRAAAIANYFNLYKDMDNNQYSFKPKYDDDVERRLLKQGITRKLAYTLDVGKMSAADRASGQSLSSVIDYGRGEGADKIKVEISVGPHNTRGLSHTVNNAITTLKDMMVTNAESVSKFEVAGKEDKDHVTEVLDLISHRLTLEVDDVKTGTDLRFPREQRWEQLVKARKKWKTTLKA